MGRAIALNLASKEHVSGLALCDVNEKDLNETVALCLKAAPKCKVVPYLVDVSNKERVEKWRDEVVRDFGGCDALFNNAGINANGKMVYGAHDDPVQLEKMWDRCFNIDFYGVLYCTRAFLPVLISRTEAYLINTSSVNAFWTWPEHTAYTAAKHAVKGLTDSLMIELKIKAPHVHVALLHPGGVKTEIAKTTLHPHNDGKNAAADKLAERFALLADLTSDEAATWIVGAVKKDQYRVLVGYDAIFIDKMVRLFPERVYGFYEQFGKEGLIADAWDPNMKNDQIVGPLVAGRLIAAGLWTNLLFMWPIPLLGLRRSPAGRAALYVAGAGVAGYLVKAVFGGPAPKAKL